MSLAADDGEGEQNELRNLQAQLTHTNELVETLSRQLNELKEQVTYLLVITSTGCVHFKTPFRLCCLNKMFLLPVFRQCRDILISFFLFLLQCHWCTYPL